jgi:hypothetical protein
MGTNYYLHQKGNLLERLEREVSFVRHIGKSSGGWCFALRVYPEEGINSLTDWYHVLRRDNNIIFDEYSNEVTLEHLLDVITNRSWKERVFQPTDRCPTEEHMLNFNHAVYGPNNLLRHRIGQHCVGHGPGTWDLIPGDFS